MALADERHRNKFEEEAVEEEHKAIEEEKKEIFDMREIRHG